MYRIFDLRKENHGILIDCTPQYMNAYIRLHGCERSQRLIISGLYNILLPLIATFVRAVRPRHVFDDAFCIYICIHVLAEESLQINTTTPSCIAATKLFKRQSPVQNAVTVSVVADVCFCVAITSGNC